MNTQSQDSIQECNDLLKQGPGACALALQAELTAIAEASPKPEFCMELAVNKARKSITKLSNNQISFPIAVVLFITGLKALRNKGLALGWLTGAFELEVTKEQDVNNPEHVVFLRKWVRVEKQNNLNSANNLQ